MLQRQTVGIVGTGQVGMAAAYAIFLQKSASRLLLIDLNHQRAEGEAIDLMHGQAYVGRCDVDAGDYAVSQRGADGRHRRRRQPETR